IEIESQGSYDSQTVKTLSKLSNSYGIPLEFESLPSNINGMYYDGKIVINKNSSDPLVTVFTHELTHSLESTQTYNELVESVINHLNTTSLISDLNAVIDEEVYRVIQERAELGINLNYDQAHKEVIAEYISEYIADDSFINSISSNKSIVQRIVDWLKNIVTSLTGSKEQKAYKDLLNKYQKALTQVNYQPVNINELNAGTPFSITPIQNKELSNTKTTETENILKEVRNQYKITTNANEAGYIDLDGKMIDFSGKQEGGASNVRYMDHSDLYLDDSDVDYKKYIDMGNIRTFPETGGFELIYKPNKEQVNALLKYLKTNTVAKNEGSFVGISSPNKIGYYDIANLEFSNNKTANEILNEVMSYFDNESMDLNQAKYSVNKDNLRKDGSRKDLMAIHNLSASKLLNANELGGFPMPSLAVTKDSISHDGYGDISLIFNKDTINPSNRDNKIYNRDAWTPTFPSVNYNVNDTYSIRKVFDNKINNSNYIKQYAEGYDIQKIITRLYEENIGDILKNSEGNLNKLTENFSDIDSLKLLYAEEKGIKLDPIYKETQPNFDVWKEIVDLYGGAENLENNINNRDYLKTKINELSKIVGKDLLTEQFRIKLYVKTALDSVKEGNQTVLDKSAVINELSKKIDNQDYKNWINDNITNKITYKKGIRNNKDPFTYSGKRRSFNELHSPVTLNNVVTNMKAQKQNDSIIGVNNLLGNLASEFNSIQDVIDSRDTLAKRDNVYKDSMNRYHDQMINLANEVISYNPILDEGFNGISNVIDTVGYHLTKATTAKQLQTKVNKDVGWKLALGTAERFIQFKNDLNKQPSSYFEAKPKRAVTFDEINTAVIPKNSSADVINMLENKGINYVTYDPNIEGDRNRVINTIEDAKFSPKKEIRNNIITLNKEIPGLREKITNTTNILMQDDDAGLRKLLQQTAKEIIDNGEVSPNTYQIIIDYVTENAGVQDPSFKRSELVKYLRSVSPISVKPRSFANGENLFSANQDLPYGVNFTTNPGPDDQGLDSIWGEMQGMFPGVFDDDGSIAGDSTTSFTTEEDMIGRVFDVLNTRGKKLYYFKDEYGYDTFKDMVTQSLNEYLADIKVSMKHKDTVMKKSNLKQTKNILKDNVITDSINGIASKAYESDIKP
ncbi:MAG: hypothetical protein GX675_07740, partial [Erysipelotrichaceae bacterium]|nr:hypothetical protein [Erysipelotrichaceae bacterium]